jgi:hypothetical protein
MTESRASSPEVQALGRSGRLFFGSFGSGGRVSIGEYLPGAGESASGRPLVKRAIQIFVGRDYFTALEITLLRGRLFNRLDSVPKAEKVTVIDETLARQLRPDGNALDCLVQWGIGNDYFGPYRVVGIVAHVSGIADREECAQMYVPTGPDTVSSYLYLRLANGRSADLLRQRIAQEIHRFDSHIPVLSVATLAERRDDNAAIWLAGFGARLALAAGAAALFLASLGIYAIKGHMVASRTSEIGIRQALGATRGNIIGMVLREGLALTMAGLLIGLLAGLGIAKVSASMLYGISPADPISIIATVVLLGAVSLLASYIPARRAAKVDPMVALRHE